jgi:hypothetical protein
MHLVGIDATSRQLSKLRNGHKVRVKQGTGFNLVVHPENYHLVHRAFNKGKATDIKLTPDEIEENENLSPESHEELKDASPMASMEGGSIFGKMKKASKSKHGRMARKMAYEMGADTAHEGIQRAHAKASEYAGDNEYAHAMIGDYANRATKHVEKNRLPMEQRGGSIYKQIKKGLTGKTAKSIYKHTKPLRQAAYEMGSEKLNDYISQAQSGGMDMAGDNPYAQMMVQDYGNKARSHVERNRAPQSERYMYGHGLGAGVGGMNAHDALRLASLANAQANHKLAQMHNASVHGQMTQPPIKRYWDDPLEPHSRGTGVRNNSMNFIRGKGTLLPQDSVLHPALRSQPYGANFQFQHFLPPQYAKYSNGGEMEGYGLYI